MIEYAPLLLALIAGLALGLVLPRRRPKPPPGLLRPLALIVLADWKLRKVLGLPPPNAHYSKGRIDVDALLAAADALLASCQQVAAKIADLKAKQEDPVKVADLQNKLRAVDQAVQAMLA